MKILKIFLTILKVYLFVKIWSKSFLGIIYLNVIYPIVSDFQPKTFYLMLVSLLWLLRAKCSHVNIYTDFTWFTNNYTSSEALFLQDCQEFWNEFLENLEELVFPWYYMHKQNTIFKHTLLCYPSCNGYWICRRLYKTTIYIVFLSPQYDFTIVLKTLVSLLWPYRDGLHAIVWLKSVR